MHGQCLAKLFLISVDLDFVIELNETSENTTPEDIETAVKVTIDILTIVFTHIIVSQDSQINKL